MISGVNGLASALPGTSFEAASSAGAEAPDLARGKAPRERRPRGSRTERAVARIWSSFFGAAAYENDVAWNVAGGDSLRMMLTAYILERRLNTSIPFDAMWPEMRPSEFIARLENPPVEAVAADRPSIVILPGLRGEEPRLAAFRRFFEGTASFVLPRYPPWHELVQPGVTLKTVIDHVMAQIPPPPPGRPYIFLGYSVGGVIAHELTRRLTASGEKVGFVGLLDAFQSNRVKPDHAAWRPSRKKKKQPLAMRIGYRTAIAVRDSPRLLRIAALLDRLLPIPLDVSFFLHYWLISDIMIGLTDAWEPAVLNVPITLFRAQANGPNVPHDLGWTTTAPALSIEDAEGNHFTMMEGEAGRRLAAFVRAAIESPA